MNVATDVARCRRCGEVFPLSMLVQTTLSEPVDLENPPRGSWYREELDGFTVGATTRHPMAFFVAPGVYGYSA